jgi:sugar phosphate isomerase/epimerase
MFPSFNPGHIKLQVGMEEGLDLARQYGFQGYDFTIVEALKIAEERGVQALKELFEQYRLKMGNWNLPFMPYGPEDVWRTGVENLKKQAALAAEIGALRSAMWILPGSDEMEYKENFDFHVKRFQPVAEILADNGVRLGLEFVGPKTSRMKRKHPFIHDLKGVLELGSHLGSNVGILLDSWHWYCSGSKQEDLDLLTDSLLVHIHINDAPQGIDRDEQIDNHRKMPGATGVIDIDAFLKALKKANYTGPVTAEPFDAETNALPTEEKVRVNADSVLGVMRKSGVLE